MFHGGFIFVYNAFGYIQVWHKFIFSANDTVKSKLLYERDVANYGVCIQGYHTDNGVFTSKYFMVALIEKYQHIQFSGSGADHHNGVAECGIQTVIQMDWTMLIRYSMRSPQGNITAELWPMAIDHVVWLYNGIPRKDSGMSKY